MKIDLRNIPPEGLRIEAKESVEILDIKGEGIEFNEPIGISILVNCVGNTLLVNGELRTSIELVCSRCMKKYRQFLEDRNFNLTREVSGMNEIDLSSEIREDIFILLPVKPLCKEECKGFCPRCGRDLNEGRCSCNLIKEDIRWGGLEGLG